MVPAPSPVQIAAAEDRLRALVDQPSWSLAIDDLAACARLVGDLFDPIADEVDLLDLQPLEEVDERGLVRPVPLGQVVRAVRRPHAPRRVLLIGHYDTVFPPGSAFAGVTESDGIWRGPGVVDAKGGLVVAALALELAEAAGLEVGWEVLVVPDEEIGSPGSAAVSAAAASHADLGLGYEPAMPDGAIAAARPGSANWVHVVSGKAAHAGRELAEGRNAVLAAAALAARIQALNDDPELLANPGMLHGGTALNIVPDLAVLRSNVRATSGEAMDRATAAIATAMQEIGVEGIRIAQHGGVTRPPKELTDGYARLLAAVVATAADLGITLHQRDTGGVCDGNVLAGAGLVNVDNLGPVGGDLHRPSEYLIPSSIGPRARLSAEVLVRFDRGELGVET